MKYLAFTLCVLFSLPACGESYWESMDGTLPIEVAKQRIEQLTGVRPKVKVWYMKNRTRAQIVCQNKDIHSCLLSREGHIVITANHPGYRCQETAHEALHWVLWQAHGDPDREHRSDYFSDIPELCEIFFLETQKSDKLELNIH